MIVVRGTEHWRDQAAQAALQGGPVLTAGNFDGVHRGHQALIAETRALARELSAPSAVLTFDPAPRDVLRPENGIPRIQSLERKLEHLARTGIDAVVVQPFDLALAGLDAASFARRLRDHLGVVAMVVGHDFRFGRGRQGGADTLRSELSIPVRELEALVDEHGPISSSRVREALKEGRVADAARLLGHPHELVGRVTRGDQRGRLIGFPTANLSPSEGGGLGGLLPPNGVYAVRVRGISGEQPLPGVANLGTRPTFEGQGQRLEVHLLDFEGDLYDREMVVELIERLRPEQRFPSVDALIAQIRQDAEEARSVLG